jgi:hypothetical protein
MKEWWILSTTIPLVMLLIGITTRASAVQSSCLSLNPPQSLTLQLESLSGQQVDLRQYQGIQALILGNRFSATKVQAISEDLTLEFGRLPIFRQVILIKVQVLPSLQPLALDRIRQLAPPDSDKFFFTVDFEGTRSDPIERIVKQVFPHIDFSEQAALLFLDGTGQVLSVHDNVTENNLLIRQCLRQKLQEIKSYSKPTRG